MARKERAKPRRICHQMRETNQTTPVKVLRMWRLGFLGGWVGGWFIQVGG